LASEHLILFSLHSLICTQNMADNDNGRINIFLRFSTEETKIPLQVKGSTKVEQIDKEVQKHVLQLEFIPLCKSSRKSAAVGEKRAAPKSGPIAKRAKGENLKQSKHLLLKQQLKMLDWKPIKRYYQQESFEFSDLKNYFDINDICEGFQNFIIIKVLDGNYVEANKNFSPSERVDTFWHCFLLHNTFAALVYKILEVDIIAHKPPAKATSCDHKVDQFKRYENTLNRMEEVFGSINETIWPEAKPPTSSAWSNGYRMMFDGEQLSLSQTCEHYDLKEGDEIDILPTSAGC